MHTAHPNIAGYCARVLLPCQFLLTYRDSANHRTDNPGLSVQVLVDQPRIQFSSTRSRPATAAMPAAWTTRARPPPSPGRCTCASPTGPTSLTMRQCEHLGRFGEQGRHGKDIATRLFISPRTVQTYVTHVTRSWRSAPVYNPCRKPLATPRRRARGCVHRRPPHRRLCPQAAPEERCAVVPITQSAKWLVPLRSA